MEQKGGGRRPGNPNQPSGRRPNSRPSRGGAAFRPPKGGPPPNQQKGSGQPGPPRQMVPTGPQEDCQGVLEVGSQGWGILRAAQSWLDDPKDIFVPQDLIRRYSLRPGQMVEGKAVPPNGSQKRPSATQVLTIEGVAPDEAREIIPFDRLTAESPTHRLRLEHKEGPKSSRLIDLLVPVGKGQRGLIIAPPFAGKTRLLAEIATSIRTCHPEVEVFVLLVDERPEEVTYFRRAGVGQVVASSYDSAPDKHLSLSELAMERAHRLVEQGKDVMILIDSLTRLTRACNISSSGSGRTLSGGLDPAATRFPRRLFGAARATQEAGSLTILATVLVDTESRLDDLIFEEFKGTGNWELRLDRSLTEQRLFPSVDIPRSGTRLEELLYTPEELEPIHRLRRSLRSHGGDAAGQLRLMLGWLEQMPTNEALVKAAARIAPRT